MKYGSVCSGIEGASVAFGPLGFEPSFFSEIEKFPRAVLQHHHPEVPLHGDFTTIKKGDYDDINLLIGGTPCFTGDTIVATKRGLIPIPDVVVGDRVITHTGRWQKVLKIGNKKADTVIVRGQGASDGLHTTKNHPIYAKTSERVWVPAALNGGSPTTTRAFTEPEWVDASDMKGRFWAVPSRWPVSSMPRIINPNGSTYTPENIEAFGTLVGRWLGDGWLRTFTYKKTGKIKSRVVHICCGKHELNEMEDIAEKSGINFSISEEKTTYRFTFYHTGLCHWLEKNFSKGAHNKTMPTWLFGCDPKLSSAIYYGYIGADGCTTKNGARVTTVSKKLAVGFVILSAVLNKSCSKVLSKAQGVSVIGDREIQRNDFYQLTAYDQAKSSFEENGHRWNKVKSVDVCGKETVYNLEVQNDNSYTADGIVVHNCQSFSIAGLRKGISDVRGNLALEFIKLAYRLQPEVIVWENVPGVFSSNLGEDFRSFLSALAGWDVPLPPDGWKSSGVISAAPGCYALAWRVCNAEYYGVPQRRRRVFVVGVSSGDWRSAASILFDSTSMRWDLTPRRKTWKNPAGNAPSGFDFGSDEGAGEPGGLFDAGAELGGEGPSEGDSGRATGGNGSDGSVLENGSHWDDDENPHPTLNQANAGSGSPGYSNQEIFSQRGGGLVKQEVYTSMEDNEVSQTISWREYKGLSCGRDGLTSPAVVEKPVAFSVMPMNSGKDFKGREVEVSQPIMTQPSGGNQGGDYIVDPMPFDETQITHPENRSSVEPGAPTGTLNAEGRPPTIAFQSNANACDAAAAGIDVSPTMRVGSGLSERGDPPAVAYPIHDQATRHAGKRGKTQDGKGNGLGIGADGDPSPTLTAGDNHAVAYPIDMRNAVRDPGKHDEMNRQGVGVGEDGDPAHTVTSAFVPGVAMTMAVRRLTPDECEALQGFPRGWTKIPYNGKSVEDCPAGPRYKAIGNSFAVPVIHWLGCRIKSAFPHL